MKFASQIMQVVWKRIRPLANAMPLGKLRRSSQLADEQKKPAALEESVPV